ncbi:hypothetical protein FSP39_013312, partial [Pinctada imbricata]
EWDDSRLVWSTGTYDTEYVFALSSEIWKPEIFVDNAVSDVSILTDSDLAFRVKNTGKVTWELPQIFSTHCDIDITYYPFDTQTCAVEVVSWGLTTDELELNSLRTTVNTEDLRENGEWLFKSSSVSKSELTETKSDGTTERFSLLTFSVTLTRRSSYYGKSILLPVVLTSFLVLLVFILPVDSGEKVGFSLTVLLALAVLLTLITDSIPRTSINVSVLSTYLATTLGLSVITCGASVTVISIHFRDASQKITPRMHRFVCFLARASCFTGLSCCCRKKVSPSEEEEYDKDNDESSSGSIFDDDYVFSWPEVAQILDRFLFVYMFIITTISTLSFMLTLSIGGILAS